MHNGSFAKPRETGAFLLHAYAFLVFALFVAYN